MQMNDRYAVFGNPIEHSKSPNIHAEFAKQFGENIDYQKHCIELDDFSNSAKTFFSQNGKGLNITVPFKQEAYEFADILSERAEAAGAVNTLALKDGKVLGDNTDGFGLVLDIKDNQNWQIEDASILVIGAGGAVRGVLLPLLNENPKKITIVNRTLEKAQSLAEKFQIHGNITAESFEELKGNGKAFDIVINGTSASLGGESPPLDESVVGDQTKVYDMVYGSELTPFLMWARDNSAAAVADGLGMLVGQAAESFRVWFDKRPKIAPVIKLLRSE